MHPRASRASLALALAVGLAVPAAAQHSNMTSAAGPPPPLHSGLGSWSHRVTTTSPEAQKYFDQGLNLCYGFNHDEATRAFREAARLDPRCAMAWWGVALAAGPNINLPMDAEHNQVALDALAIAKKLAPYASDAERAYIEALATRHSADTLLSRGSLDSAYAGAMRALAKRYPKDADAQVLCAESLMDLTPWNYWTKDGKPRPGTEELVAKLEGVIAAHPDHAGAHHLLIHALEASPDPRRAVASADRLRDLITGTGHLVHMPSHIYARVGRYAEAVQVNQRAVEVDERFIAEQKPTGLYPVMYYNHNIHFIWFTASMEGRSAEALAAARKVAANVTPELAAMMPMIEFIPPLPALTLVKFERWDEALGEPAPPAFERYASGLWHHARGLAFAAKGEFAAARAALDSVRAIGAAMPAEQTVSVNYAAPLLRVAANALAGAIAVREKRMDDAWRSFEAAIATEDSLTYDEPPTWSYPVRHGYGKALLAAGNAARAEAVFRKDLERHPENGWALHGLAEALRAQKKSGEADAIRKRFETAWARADVKL